MFEVRVVYDFSAAHNLREYKGQCEELHGHNWKVEALVASKRLDSIGLVVDFRKLKAALKTILKDLDHKYLNKIKYFSKVNPTSENIAKFIYNKLVLNASISGKRLKVTVWENERSSAAYYEK